MGEHNERSMDKKLPLEDYNHYYCKDFGSKAKYMRVKIEEMEELEKKDYNTKEKKRVVLKRVMWWLR